MSRLGELKSAKTLRDLAAILHFTPKGLAYILYKVPPENKYTTFSLTKKSGGERIINAPIAQLKLMQSQLSKLLYECLEELESTNPSRRNISHGFHKQRGIISNALPHRRSRYVLNLDITDFFGAINFGRVRGYFISDKSFSLDPAIATIIAQIACHNNQLPQGSPSSPIISNLILRILDVRLARLAKNCGCMYTRYADDMTFSTRQRTFPPKLAKPLIGKPHKWRLMKALSEEIKDSGFEINKKKTRMQIIGSRQDVTGIVVNEKINIKQDYYRNVRSMCHSLFRTGTYYISGVKPDENGAIALTDSLRPIEGRLAHVYYVKARRDRTESENRNSQHHTPTAVRDLYKKFLYYKYFINSPAPLIITEGKTDIIYLRSAMRARYADHPQLAKLTKENPVRIIPSFMKPSYINNVLLGLGSGASQIPGFIQTYKSRVTKYGHAPMPFPVIVIVDNDDGGKSVCKAAMQVSNSPITLKNPDCWFHLCDNLYLVKTPLGPGENKHSCIEDLFPKSLKSKLVDGKPFDIKKEHADHTSYGKAVFAEQVVQKLAKVEDFAEFDQFLKSIVHVIDDYAAKLKTKMAEPINPAKKLANL